MFTQLIYACWTQTFILNFENFVKTLSISWHHKIHQRCVFILIFFRSICTLLVFLLLIIERVFSFLLKNQAMCMTFRNLIDYMLVVVIDLLNILVHLIECPNLIVKHVNVLTSFNDHFTNSFSFKVNQFVYGSKTALTKFRSNNKLLLNLGSFNVPDPLNFLIFIHLIAIYIVLFIN